MQRLRDEHFPYLIMGMVVLVVVVPILISIPAEGSAGATNVVVEFLAELAVLVAVVGITFGGAAWLMLRVRRGSVPERPRSSLSSATPHSSGVPAVRDTAGVSDALRGLEQAFLSTDFTLRIDPHAVARDIHQVITEQQRTIDRQRRELETQRQAQEHFHDTLARTVERWKARVEHRTRRIYHLLDIARCYRTRAETGTNRLNPQLLWWILEGDFSSGRAIKRTLESHNVELPREVYHRREGYGNVLTAMSRQLSPCKHCPGEVQEAVNTPEEAP